VSGDYKIELIGRSGHWLISKDSFETETEAREEIWRRQEAGTYGGCEAYIRNSRTGWRSSEVKPKAAKECK
jgi:hypothetical protein